MSNANGSFLNVCVFIFISLFRVYLPAREYRPFFLTLSVALPSHLSIRISSSSFIHTGIHALPILSNRFLYSLPSRSFALSCSRSINLNPRGFTSNQVLAITSYRFDSRSHSYVPYIFSYTSLGSGSKRRSHPSIEERASCLLATSIDFSRWHRTLDERKGQSARYGAPFLSFSDFLSLPWPVRRERTSEIAKGGGGASRRRRRRRRRRKMSTRRKAHVRRAKDSVSSERLAKNG